MGPWCIPPWKVHFPRTFHTTPHHTTFCGLPPWKVIFIMYIRFTCCASHAKAKRGASRSIELGAALCFSRRRPFIPAAVRNRSALRTDWGKSHLVRRTVDVSHQETPSGPTLPSMVHSHIPEVSHQEQNRPLTHFYLLIYHIRCENDFPRTFCSSSYTLGNLQPAPEPTPGHILKFLKCHIRREIGLPRRFCSSSYTSGGKSVFHAYFVPNLTHQETADLPQSPLQGTSRNSRSVTSGRKSAFHAHFAPEVSHQERGKQN